MLPAEARTRVTLESVYGNEPVVETHSHCIERCEKGGASG